MAGEIERRGGEEPKKNERRRLEKAPGFRKTNMQSEMCSLKRRKEINP